MANTTFPILLLLLVTLLGCHGENAPSPPTTDHPQTKNLHDYFTALTTLKKFNGAVLLTRAGDRVYCRAHVINEPGTSTLQVTKDAQFNVHSIAKLMAKAVVVDLVDEGKLAFEDKVSAHIGDFPRGDAISIRQLLEHQSGLPRELTTDVPRLVDKSPEEMVGLIAGEKLQFEPGTETAYSNLGYQLLYYIISQVTGKSFVQHLNERYFVPLGMEDSGANFHLAKDNLRTPVTNYEEEDGAIVAVDRLQPGDKGQASVYSTVADLTRFIEAVSKAPYRERLKGKSRNVIGQSGGGDGLLCHVEHNFTGDYTLAFFSNYDEIPFGDIVLTVEAIMTGGEYTLPGLIDRKAVDIDRELLAGYAGRYMLREFNNQVFEFRLEGENLVFFQEGERQSKLFAESDSTFFDMPTAEDYFGFRETAAGGYDLVFYFKGVEMLGAREE